MTTSVVVFTLSSTKLSWVLSEYVGHRNVQCIGPVDNGKYRYWHSKERHTGDECFCASWTHSCWTTMCPLVSATYHSENVNVSRNVLVGQQWSKRLVRHHGQWQQTTSAMTLWCDREFQPAYPNEAVRLLRLCRHPPTSVTHTVTQKYFASTKEICSEVVHFSKTRQMFPYVGFRRMITPQLKLVRLRWQTFL